MAPLSAIFKRLILAALQFYQMGISPFKGPTCRFYPSCSQYAYDAIASHGLFKGSFLSIKRILKCHPFHPGGFDPVPK
jgi:putative membrane protein insertion efficiency factor